MPTATVTVRELKNKESGLDLSIPKTREVPGMFSKTVEYYVMVVSNLSCFKSPKHKDTDVVQFVVNKTLEDFEDLRKKMIAKFTGTVLPTLPKKMLMLTEGSVQERRQQLEHFLKVIAATLKLASCHITLEFLGVNPIKAGRFTSGDGVKVKAETSWGADIFEEAGQEDTGDDLFGDSETADTDLFDIPSNTAQSRADTQSATELGTGSNLFEAPDLGRAVNEEERDQFLVPGAIELEPETRLSEQLEDNSELLNIDDDLDKLLNLSSVKPASSSASTTMATEDAAASSQKVTPSKPSKPTPGPKPATAPKPGAKPAVPGSKPIVPGSKPTVPGSKPTVPGSKPTVPGSKPTLPVKPTVASKPETLGSNDILKYIQDNSQSADDDLDLFS